MNFTPLDHGEQGQRSRCYRRVHFSITPHLKHRYEPYLSYITNVKYRVAICRLRTSSYNLPIEMGRYIGLKTEERICNKCNLNEVGSELHVIFRCANPKLENSRHELYQKINIFGNQIENLTISQQLIYLLSCSDRDITNTIGNYLEQCLNLHSKVKYL